MSLAARWLEGFSLRSWISDSNELFAAFSSFCNVCPYRQLSDARQGVAAKAFRGLMWRAHGRHTLSSEIACRVPKLDEKKKVRSAQRQPYLSRARDVGAKGRPQISAAGLPVSPFLCIYLKSTLQFRPDLALRVSWSSSLYVSPPHLSLPFYTLPKDRSSPVDLAKGLEWSPRCPQPPFGDVYRVKAYRRESRAPRAQMEAEALERSTIQSARSCLGRRGRGSIRFSRVSAR